MEIRMELFGVPLLSISVGPAAAANEAQHIAIGGAFEIADDEEPDMPYGFAK